MSSGRAVPSVSIVISTLDRAAYLRRLLMSLNHLAYPEFEVVVVDGPSRDDTAAVLAEFAGRIKVARCAQANLSRSRNIGIATAAGDIVAFIDDDALPGSPDWLSSLVEGFAAEPRLGGCGGPVLVGDSDTVEFESGVTSDYGLQIFVGREGGGARVAPDGVRWFARVAGCNCAFRRDVLFRVGGFDENLTYVFDETDVCVRIARAGFDIQPVQAAFVRHYRAPSNVRRSFHDLAWAVIARADTYFALKNGGDPLPRRLLTALALLPRKHPFQQIEQWYRDGHYGPDRRLLYVARAARGVISGVWFGCWRPRHTAAAPTTSPAFLPFPRAHPARRLRVGLLCRAYPPNPHSGGIATYTQELALGLHALGHDVHVFTESADTLRREGLRLLVHGLTPDPLSVIRTSPTTDRHLRWAIAVANRVMELARAGTDFDLFESPNWEVEGAGLRRSGVFPLVVRLHSPLAMVAETNDWPRSSDLETAMALERWLISEADGVTSSTKAVVQSVRDTTGIDVEREMHYARIPLGILPQPPGLATSDGPPRLLFVGRLELRKGIQTLLAALPGLLQRYPDLHVDVVGDHARSAPGGGTFRSRFEAQHHHASWRGRCRFHGIVPPQALQKVYRACTLFVAPSLYESFGLIYLEAMRWGKPVIACRSGGPSEIIRDGETGLLVPPDDATALSAAIGRLLDDPDLRRRLGEQGQQAVEKEFSSRLMAERTAAFYLDVLERVDERYRHAFASARGRRAPIELKER